MSKPNREQQAGLFYATTDDGQELPIIDVSHPAFAIRLEDGEMERRLQEHAQVTEQHNRTPVFIQNIFLRFMMRRSRIMRALSGAAGGFLGGMDTYILKLGPDNMHEPYASNIDAQISGSFPGLVVRLRLQYIAQLLADALGPMLAAAPHDPLHLVNIGGGPAIDSLNALMLLQRSDAHLLASRQTFVHVLDLDEAGPNFGRRALQALQGGDGPLRGLTITFERLRYDWSDATILKDLLRSIGSQALVAASSEGALFEYGDDAVITDNLQALDASAAGQPIVVGSVTRADETGRLMNSSGAALQMRGLDAFAALARSAGWRITKQIDRPAGYDVLLRKLE